MVDYALLLLFVISFGTACSSVGLSLALWKRDREKKLLKTFLFLSYMAVLWLLAGGRFYLETAGGWNDPVSVLVGGVLERIAFAFLIYFLPATVNYILGRKWSLARLLRTLAAAAVYLVSGVASLLTGGAAVLGSLAAAALVAMVLFVLTDASRSLPMVRDDRIRLALSFLYGLTFAFLPLAQILPLLLAGMTRVLFLMGCLYVLALGVTADMFFLRRLSTAADEHEAVDFPARCAAAGLTPRECQIAGGIAQGLTYKEIAADLDISPNTVSNHVTAIYRKTETRSKVEMVNALRGS